MTKDQVEKDRIRIEHYKKMAKRFDLIPGFLKKFNAEFLIESKKHSMGTVDTEALTERLLKEMNVADVV